MDDSSAKWFLMKQEDGDVFGPMAFSQLRQWAADAFISPLDKISSDGIHWVKAPMIPELQMDYLVDLEGDHFYGPTTIGAIREFLNNGEISPDTLLTNCQSGEKTPLRDFLENEQLSEGGKPALHVNVGEHLQARVRELEEALLQERQQHEITQDHLAKAHAHIAELEQQLAMFSGERVIQEESRY